jgi:preprotein translocase subunit SecE
VSESARAAASGAEGADSPRPGRDESAKRGLFARIALFVRQVVAELKKVVRPTRPDLITYTTVVLVFVAVVMAFVTLLDLGIGSLVGWIFGG